MDTIETCISFQVSAAAKTIARLSRARLAPFGVTPIQFAVLQAVSESSAPSAAEVGALLSIDSATIVGVLDRLTVMGLIGRVPDPADRRINRLELTQRGREELPRMGDAMDHLNAEVDALLGASASTTRDSLAALSALSSGMKG